MKQIDLMNLSKAATSKPASDGRPSLPESASASLAAARTAGNAGPVQDAPTVLAMRQCQSLLKQRLNRPLLDLFHELTRLQLHTWWHKPPAEWQPGDPPKLCPRTRQRPAGKLPETCEACLRKRWQQAWNNLKTEKRFAGLCGSTNYCACVKVIDLRPVTLLVQQTAPASPARTAAFIRAVSLTRLIIHDLQATIAARRALHEPGSAATCSPFIGVLAAGLPGILPGKGTGGRDAARTRTLEPGATSAFMAQAGIPETSTERTGNNRRQQTVQRMLDYLHEHYSHPVQLGDLAAAMNMNATYISSLFSTMTGVTFHHYLEELRLAKAKALLRDPIKQITEVAYAVGYANPNQFRSVFKTRVGIPPSTWRQNARPASGP